jgi:anti-sigma factor RsiW
MAFGRGPEQQRLSPVERANLVAYLDGELNDAESRVISTKLTQSPTARREVEALERTWQLLDHLPLPQAPEDFCGRTLTGIRQEEEKGGRLATALAAVTHRIAWIAVWLVATLVAVGCGFALTTWAWPNPTARLTRDLSLAEHLDEYREVGSFEFLKELASSPEFLTNYDD